MPTHANLIKQTISNTPGTSGALTLSTASTGYLGLGASHDGQTFNVTIYASDSDTADKEVADGCVYTHSGTSLSRGTLESSTTGSALNLTSSAIVMITIPASSARKWDQAITAELISGLTLANNDTDAANDIDIAAGTATVTDGASWYVVTTTGLTKRLDASWAVGTNAGGLDTGAEANSTWYHVWLIQRSDTGVVDALFSTSATAPTMPTNYDRKRRIGAVRNDGSGNILPFTQLRDAFLWNTRTKDVSAADPGTSAVLRTLTVPGGIKVDATVAHTIVDNSYAGATYVLLSSPDATDTTPGIEENSLVVNGTGLSTFAAVATLTLRTNTSSQIRSRLSASDADRTLRIQTIGWIDPRGRA